MRPVGLADLEMAARVLMRVAPDARRAVMQDMIVHAKKADTFRAKNGVPHPLWGTGTLMSCALRQKIAPRPATLETDALHAYFVVSDTLMAQATHQTA